MDMDLVIGVGAGAVIGLMAGNILIPIIWEWYESWR